MDVELLSRIQFGLTIGFHYIYPPLSIGLGLLLVIFEGLYLKTKDKKYEQLTRFWIKIFALTFGIGVATGIVMEFEFGTNWGSFSKYVGDVFGSALAAEGLFAFALESGFLGILLFGWNRVKPIMHFISTVGVFFGSLFSAIWIVVANSWMQTPSGFHIVGEGMSARAEITDFWAMVFNPSSVDRILHVWLGAFLAGAFLVLSVHAYYLIKNKHIEISKIGFKIALIIAAIFSIIQLYTGHRSAEVVAEYQPAKLAAMEGHYKASAPADLYLLGWVNQEAEEVYGFSIPGGLSFLVHYDFKETIPGLDAFTDDEKPKAVNAVFQFYHLMIVMGLFLIALSSYGAFLWYRKKLWDKKWLLWIFVFAVIIPQLTNQFGWYTAEMGRQPWVVYGLLRTSDALSAVVTANQVLFSLIMFSMIYLLLFCLFIYLLHKKIKAGPYSMASIDHRPMQDDISKFISKKSK